jgi:GMP synthase-like glutamine amidotransferase
MRFLVLQNDALVPPGNLAVAASHFGHDLEVIHLFEGEEIPDVSAFDGVVILGGGMGSYEEDAYPYLVSEKEFVSEAVRRAVPVLGLCLGGQMLADVLGGRAYLSDEPEVGFMQLEPTVTGDPAMDALTSGRVWTLHQDTFDVPEGATVTARSDRFVHAFRFGTALGVQSHPDVTHEIVLDWLEHPAVGQLFGHAGVDGHAVAAQMAESYDEVTDLAFAFFGAWFDEAEPPIDTTPVI